MTSEPDSKPGRRPPTIELTATEVEKPASPKDSSRDSPRDSGPSKPASERAAESLANGKGSRGSGSRVTSHAVSALIGAVAAAAIVAGLWIKGVIPSREAAAPSSASAPGATASTANIDALSARLDKIERAIQAQRPDPGLGNRLTAAEAQTKSLADTLTALSRRLDDVAATSQTAAKAADSAQAAADTAKSASQAGVQHGDIDDLANRIAALENTVKTLSADDTHPTSGADDKAARLTIATEALRAAAERGVPYQAELNAVQSLGVDQSATAPLAPYAATGIPSATALGHELAALAPALDRAAETTPGDTTFLGRIEANAQKLVRITPVDTPSGNDPSAVIARINIDAARSDVAAALDDIAALPDSAKPLAADWAKKAQARNAAIAATRQIATDALAALSKPAAQ
jgi:hypothetical protein